MRTGEAGRKVADLCRTHGITEQTSYRWKAKYGGMEIREMQRLKPVEDENRRLKQIVADNVRTLNIVDDFTRECVAIAWAYGTPCLVREPRRRERFIALERCCLRSSPVNRPA